MKTSLLIICSLLLFSSCQFEKKRIGLKDDFTNAEGWYEVVPPGDTISPSLKLEPRSGVLIIHHRHRTLEQAYKWCPWIKWKRDFSTNLRKKYGAVDLDKYHYVVINVQQKGSSSYFDINGFTTKLGYSTGITAIDLKDYDDPRISGKKKVDFGIDLQDNNTYLVLEELKFVSKLNKEEKQKLIGAGLTIRNENLKPRPYHGLEALKEREDIPIPNLDGEEMAIFRDDATGGITTRLTAAPGNDNFGEGGIWSTDGAAVKFESPRNNGGMPICLLGEGRVIAGPAKAVWNIWSPIDPNILYAMKKEGMKFTVSSWDKESGKEIEIANFTVPEIGSYVEFKNFTDLGNLVVGFRETPHLYIVDVRNNTVKYIKLPVRLKDAAVEKNEKIVIYANCYTFEVRSYNVETREQGLVPSFSAGHASWGPNGMVANFGGHLNVFVPDSIGINWTPGDLISIWANWKNDIVTDYGSLTYDNKYVFTNGRKADVDSQHLMIPSADPGAVMRVARYFTKFSWTSTTYSRPSPDYTKLIYNENVIGNTELHMVYTRRPNSPATVKLEGSQLSWSVSEPNKEISGYNIYASNQSGRDYVRINDKPFHGNEFTVDNKWKYYSVASVEHSGLESSLSHEVSPEGARSFYFEAEEMTLVPPARRFFDGYCNNFQCVRINAESESESANSGMVRIPLKDIPAGEYTIWGRVKGKGNWLVGKAAVAIAANEWQWIKLGTFKSGNHKESLDIASMDDALKLDLILVTADDFIPQAPYPCDGTAPGQVQGLTAIARSKQITLSWTASQDRDIHHYSVYCGKTPDFICNNETIIRSVLKTSVTDAVPFNPKGLYYKVVAVDNRWNESEPVMVAVK
jgi:hypothetical protein